MTFRSRAKSAAALVGLLLLFALVLSGCGAEPTAAPPPPTSAAQPTEVAAAPTVAPTEPPPTEPPTLPPPTDTPQPTETPVPIDDSGCITCHTSDATLQALATEEEAPEVESEGEG
jgi:hypothetical protein